MSAKLLKQIDVEIEQINQLIDIHRPLLLQCAQCVPDQIELSALAAMLHSFYTGVENIFKRIIIELGDEMPSGEFWHRELLDAMMEPGQVREPVFSESLRNRLRDYLGFRHVFRQAYTFQLKWERMAFLVLECEETFRDLETELRRFIALLQQNGSK